MAQRIDSGPDAMRQLAILNRIARIAVEDMALRPMLQRVVDTLAEEFQWEFIACAGIDAANCEFVCEAVYSALETDVTVGYRRALGSGVVGECAITGRTIAIDDIDDIRDHPNFVDTLHGTRSELCVPVMHKGEVLAVLNAESRRVDAFRGQRALLETVADQIAGVIRAARLLEALQQANAQLQDAYQAMESLSQLDGLTGLANRRCFDGWIGQALELASASRRSLALLLVDVDHFKAYNDGYGHLAGDSCLKQVASLLAYMLEGTTMRLARYGGEEFVILVPDADVAAALVQAERLRLAMETRSFVHRYCDAGKVTISVGAAACIPDPGARADALLVPADAALYDAKRSGRNCVRAATSRARVERQDAGV
ncbi:sensor domain-containing diguanylate cyclase [Lysobacter sp. CFH 32150]|uniref:sensor domain-containing diguanylate cyclase n=1 Tax=Lysobacter sp. CFH 32150 TaxID=2927128 RepID=UPI001FA726BF|nr:sensor domain-containing diguanylate cyclase [Lysobacter sp. CFH 32150]MCI4568271.1 sensor domain-containing diguanylate cyclase [Lysobacter sp. CFH 32150]